MTNPIATEVDTLLADAKVFFVKELSKIENGFTTAIADVNTVLTGVANAAGPIIVAAAKAGVTAALANTTGGLSAIATAGEAAAVGVLSSQGVQLADTAANQLKVLVLGNVLKANSAPAGTPTGTN